MPIAATTVDDILLALFAMLVIAPACLRKYLTYICKSDIPFVSAFKAMLQLLLISLVISIPFYWIPLPTFIRFIGGAAIASFFFRKKFAIKLAQGLAGYLVALCGGAGFILFLRFLTPGH